MKLTNKSRARSRGYFSSWAPSIAWTALSTSHRLHDASLRFQYHWSFIRQTLLLIIRSLRLFFVRLCLIIQAGEQDKTVVPDKTGQQNRFSRFGGHGGISILSSISLTVAFASVRSYFFDSCCLSVLLSKSPNKLIPATFDGTSECSRKIGCFSSKPTKMAFQTREIRIAIFVSCSCVSRGTLINLSVRVVFSSSLKIGTCTFVKDE